MALGENFDSSLGSYTNLFAPEPIVWTGSAGNPSVGCAYYTGIEGQTLQNLGSEPQPSPINIYFNYRIDRGNNVGPAPGAAAMGVELQDAAFNWHALDYVFWDDLASGWQQYEDAVPFVGAIEGIRITIGQTYVLPFESLDAYIDSITFGTTPPPLTASVTKFYQGLGTLEYRSDLPFGAVGPGSLAVRSDGVVAIGNADPSAPTVVTGSAEDEYAAWTDESHDHPVEAVKAVKWVEN